jgi:hypothetical protein
MTKRTFSLFIALLFTTIIFAQSVGKLNGYVKDARSQQGLEGVQVTLEGSGQTSISDSNGYYHFSSIPTQTYSVKASLVGYSTQTQYNVIITSGNANNINFFLQPEGKDLGEVKIKGRQQFNKQIETPLSINSLSAQEVKSFPGANFDIVKVAQSLPGVSGSVGFRNDLIIRGGAPNENVYYLDGIEVPNINHFATQGSGGGPVGMLNVAFIDQVTLSTSAFNAKYDNPMSGVLQFRQKTGNPERLQGNFRLGASEAAITLEGPLNKKKNLTYIASVRRSYLQALFQLIKLPFLPDYWDYQYKVTYKPTKKDEINLIGLNAIDNFFFNPPKTDGETDNIELQRNLFILNGVAKYQQYSATAGLSWKHLVRNGFSNVAISTNLLRNKITKYDDNDEGNVAKLRIKLKSDEWESKLRWDMTMFAGKWKYSYGANVTVAHFSNDLFQKIYTNTITTITANTRLDYARFGAFGTLNRNLMSNRLNISFGLRTDMNTFTNTGLNPLKTLSPRLSATYAISSRINFNASTGIYYKIPPYTVLGYEPTNSGYLNKDAEYIRSTHYTAGFEFLNKRAGRLTVEGFYKLYNNYPVSVQDSISLANKGGNFGVLGNERIASIGLGRTYGLEISYQQKLTKNFYGIVSYTYYVSEYTGFNKNVYIPSAWDNRHLFTFTGGYKFKHNLEIGARMRYLGGAPYTPYDSLASPQTFLTVGEGKLDYSRFNTLRLNQYFGMDIRIDKKWNFKKWTLDLFLDMQNVTSATTPSQPDFALRRDIKAPQNFIDKQGNSVTLNQARLNPNNIQTVALDRGVGSLVPSVGMVVEF